MRIPLLFKVVLIAAAAAFGCAESSVTPMGSPELVLSEMKLGGAERVADRIDSDLRFAQTVMDGIASGDSLWLEVAAQLPLNSAAAEANFIIALAGALPRNPERVLSLLPQKAEVRDVCAIPFLRATPELVLSYYDGAVAAIARVRAPSLARAAQACAVTLASARERKLERIDSSYLVKNKPAAPKPAPRRRRAR